MILWPTCHHNRISYTGKTTSLYWLRALMFHIYFHANHHNITSLWVWYHLKSPASQLFAQPFAEAQIEENIKALCHWPLWEKSTSDQWIPLAKGQLKEKCFHWMTSSCNIFYWLMFHWTLTAQHHTDPQLSYNIHHCYSMLAPNHQQPACWLKCENGVTRII